MTTFSDHFSSCAGAYAAFRPAYPAALIDHLAGLAPGRELAWDCGTGSGQAAVLLAERFARVVATDASAEQIRHAAPHPRVTYRVGLEDGSSLDDGTADLVTVAQALHWFVRPRFYGEVHRVLRPGGVLAAWTYGMLEVSPAVDAIVARFYADRVGRYWPPERRHVETGYRDLEFPFPELEPGSWSTETRLTRPQVLGYVGTWSAVKECRAQEGVDPVTELERELTRAWSDSGEPRTARWPIALRVGRRPLGPTGEPRDALAETEVPAEPPGHSTCCASRNIAFPSARKNCWYGSGSVTGWMLYWALALTSICFSPRGRAVTVIRSW
jgi:SAM-dependent methyltransferase